LEDAIFDSENWVVRKITGIANDMNKADFRVLATDISLAGDYADFTGTCDSISLNRALLYGSNTIMRAENI
jgi:hypothetical protein